MGWAVTADPVRFDEAIEWLLQRVVLSSDEAAALDADARQRAFWVGGGLQLAQVQRVFDEINYSVAHDEPFEDFRKRVRHTLTDAAHAETVFRNAVQRAYNAGRYRQHRQVQQYRPYWMFDAILDSRTTAICAKRDGVTLPADHEWWDGNHPPLHHRCRSGVRSLRKAEADERGITNVPPVLPGTPGWGALPDNDPIWKPDAKDFEPGLVDELGKKAGAAPRKPQGAPEHDPKHWEETYAHLGAAAPAAAYGRAALERGLDRSAAEVLADFQALRDAGHPSFQRDFTELAKLPPNRPLRGSVTAEQQKALIALAEHARSIQRGGAFALNGAANPAIRDAYKFYELSLDRSVRRPSDWTIERQPGARAYASRSARKVVLSEQSRTSIAVHELAHAIETVDERALARSLAFLHARTKGEDARSLREITGVDGYDVGEVARPDRFLDAYTGKDYGKFATEVTSMGYQWLVERLQELGDRDPEMLFFLLGQLAGR